MTNLILTPFQDQLVAHLRQGVGHWITADAAADWSRAITTEWDRVLLWHGRVNPDHGMRYSYIAAARVVAEHPPSFDATWAEA